MQERENKKEKKWPCVLLLTALGIGGGYISTKYITNHASALHGQLMKKNSDHGKELADIKKSVTDTYNTVTAVSVAQLNKENEENLEGWLYDEEIGRLYEEETVGVLYQNEEK
jgi:hypothetical protein